MVGGPSFAAAAAAAARASNLPVIAVPAAAASAAAAAVKVSICILYGSDGSQLRSVEVTAATADDKSTTQISAVGSAT